MKDRKFEIVAVDFDGTLCTDAYPEIGLPNYRLIQMLKDLRANGSKIILWTCRSQEQLGQALRWCKEKGLVFDAVNDNLPEITELYGNNSRKIYADVYIDDKACFPWDSSQQGSIDA